VSRRPIVALVIATAGLAIGCGGGSSTVGTSEPAPTLSQALAYAQAVNLSSSDLPGMILVKPETRNTAHPSDAFARCTGGVSPGQRVAEVFSALFKGGPAVVRERVFLRVESTVTVMPSAALAEQEMAADASARGRACLLHDWQRLFAGRTTELLRYGAVTAVQLPASAPRTHGAHGVRLILQATVTRSGAQVPRYIDDLEFASGPAEVLLSVTSTPRPLPQATEQLLLSVLAGRALASRL
jgi:hypothetical protein